MNIENTQKILDLVIEGGNVTGKILEDKKFETSELALFFNLIDEVSALSTVNWKELPAEIKDIDAQELEALKEAFVKKFDIPQDKIESIIERVLAEVFNLVKSGMILYGIVKDIKKL